jgi:lipoprotein-releasing system ATP-binding protein
MNNALVLAAHDLHKTFNDGGLQVPVLRGVELEIKPGERVAIVGSSGSGKSTLLHLLGGLDTPTQGKVFVTGQDMATLSGAARGHLRNRTLGFVYQFHHLLPEFTALENVGMPLLIRGQEPSAAQATAQDLLERVGLGERLRHKPSKLSGGERQRAAIARALVTRPQCVLADEPTGNLDHQTAEQVFSLILQLNEDFAMSLVVVTHDQGLAARMDRVFTLDEGRLHG